MCFEVLIVFIRLDRQPVSQHLTMANTQSTSQEVDSLITQCEDLIEKALNTTKPTASL